jgi:hypothetical protein
MMAANSLLVASSGSILCLHDHNFGHLVTGEHPEPGEGCHGHEATFERTNSHTDVSTTEGFLEQTQHCVDIVIQSSDEQPRRISERSSHKKPIATSYHYGYFEPVRKVIPKIEVQLASRAPPLSCGALEQCVHKTVLRI